MHEQVASTLTPEVSVHELRPCRRSVRRGVELLCEMRSELWDGPVEMRVSDLSPEGMWIETDLALEVGAEMLASFSPPGSCLRLHALCEVSRVGLWRRTADAERSGMGVRFTDLSGYDRARLARSLIGIPPPLPRSPMDGAAGDEEGAVVVATVPQVLDPRLAETA